MVYLGFVRLLTLDFYKSAMVCLSYNIWVQKQSFSGGLINKFPKNFRKLKETAITYCKLEE